jgi:hypothetical protein
LGHSGILIRPSPAYGRVSSRVKGGTLSAPVGTCVVAGIVQYLAMFREALIILEEIAPSLKDTREHFKLDLTTWSRFRDDAAHVPDRSFREPLSWTHDAKYSDQLGPGANVLAYELENDTVTTGHGHQMVLGQAITRAGELIQRLDERIRQDHVSGLLPPPSEERRLEYLKTICRLTEPQ